MKLGPLKAITAEVEVPTEAEISKPTGNGHEELLAKLQNVEALVADALGSTQNAEGCASTAASAVESAVRRAKTKSRMLPVMSNDIVLAALDEVAWEIASLPEASVANAALMRELREGEPVSPPNTPNVTFQHFKESSVAAVEPSAAASIKTQRGEPLSIDSLELSEGDSKAFSGIASSEISSPSSPQQGAAAAGVSTTAAAHGHPSSVLTAIGGPPTREEDLESTAGSSELTTAAAQRIMGPLKKLVQEACVDPTDPECLSIRRSLKLKKPRSGDLRLAQSVDFDQCVSPRAGSPQLRGACLEFGLSATGTPKKVVPIDRHIDQYSPMSPYTPDRDQGLGGTGRILTLKGEQHSPPAGALGTSPKTFARARPMAMDTSSVGNGSPPGHRYRYWHSRGGSTSPTYSSSPSSSTRRSRKDWAAARDGVDVCDTAAPPGLLPTAKVEGIISHEYDLGDDRAVVHSPTGFGPQSEESNATPAEIGELCSQVQEGLDI